MDGGVGGGCLCCEGGVSPSLPFLLCTHCDGRRGHCQQSHVEDGGGGGVVGLIVLLELPPMHCSVTTIKCSVALTRASQPVMVTSPQILFSTC